MGFPADISQWVDYLRIDLLDAYATGNLEEVERLNVLLAWATIANSSTGLSGQMAGFPTDTTEWISTLKARLSEAFANRDFAKIESLTQSIALATLTLPGGQSGSVAAPDYKEITQTNNFTAPSVLRQTTNGWVRAKADALGTTTGNARISAIASGSGGGASATYPVVSQTTQYTAIQSNAPAGIVNTQKYDNRRITSSINGATLSNIWIDRTAGTVLTPVQVAAINVGTNFSATPTIVTTAVSLQSQDWIVVPKGTINAWIRTPSNDALKFPNSWNLTVKIPTAADATASTVIPGLFDVAMPQNVMFRYQPTGAGTSPANDVQFNKGTFTNISYELLDAAKAVIAGTTRIQAIGVNDTAAGLGFASVPANAGFARFSFTYKNGGNVVFEYPLN